LHCWKEGELLTIRRSVQIKRAGAILAVLIATLVALGAASVGPLSTVFHRPIAISANGGVASIGIQPMPEGPAGIGFQRAPTTDASRRLPVIERYIPDPLPAPLNQWFCSTGGDLTVTLGNGVQVIYGPCYRPASIDHLWAEMIYIESNGQCLPQCGPGGMRGP